MLAEIEEAIVSIITAAKVSGQGMDYLKTVDSYAGQFDDNLGEVVRAYPAVWVTFAGSGKPTRTGSNTWKVPATFVVMVAARNVRDEKAARQGTANEVGAYQILKDVRTLLLNQDLGLAIERFSPGSVKTLYNTKVGNAALAVYAQEWQTAYADHVPTEADIVDLLEFGINYYLKPGDDVADASDTLTLS